MNIDTLVESFYSKKDETESIISEVLDLFLVGEVAKLAGFNQLNKESQR